MNEVGAIGGLTPECVRVIRLGDQHVDLSYLLSNGRVADCTSSVANLWNVGRFLDATCLGAPHSGGENGTSDAARFVRRALHLQATDTIYYQAGPPIVQPTWYAGANCIEVDGENEEYIAWVPAPDEVVNALANPPYVLTWE